MLAIFEKLFNTLADANHITLSSTTSVKLKSRENAKTNTKGFFFLFSLFLFFFDRVLKGGQTFKAPY